MATTTLPTTLFQIGFNGLSDPGADWDFYMGMRAAYYLSREAAQAAVDDLTATIEDAFREDHPYIADHIRYTVAEVAREDFRADRTGRRDWREAQHEAIGGYHHADSVGYRIIQRKY